MKREDVVTAVCCREWPVVRGYMIRRCGRCGELPKVEEERVWTGGEVELRNEDR